MTARSEWKIGGSLALGLFVAYLDRTNLSVAIPSVAQDLGFSGDRFALIGSWALTIFLIGYAIANVVGGLLTARQDPKTVVIACFAIWSIATVVVACTSSIAVLLGCRLVLGLAEGTYWPQQSRFVRAWFRPEERTRANAVVQYYGQYLALAFGFMLLTPLYQRFGWRPLFVLTGGLGLAVIVPLYSIQLRREASAPHRVVQVSPSSQKLSLAPLGGATFWLLVFSYLTQAMLFWGVTLWIPLAVKSLGYTGIAQGFAASLPYLAAVLMAVPMARVSDRTGRRTQLAAFGLLVPGAVLMLLPLVDGASAKLAIITITLGLYGSCYSPNIWSIVQSSVAPMMIGSAAGIINGIGAVGGALAGFLVGFLARSTGSYLSGFVALGALVILGGFALLAYGRLQRAHPPQP